MKTRDADLLILPGLGGSGPDHWQTRWEAKLPTARRVEQADWDHPQRDEWVARVVAAVEACSRPVVLVAHSLGVHVAAHALAAGALPGVAGAFLVAPPSEGAIEGLAEIDRAFLPIPRRSLGVPAQLVASRDDPYSTFEAAERLAADWGATLLDAGEAGHINTASGHGPWPEGLMAFAGFLSRLQPPG